MLIFVAPLFSLHFFFFNDTATTEIYTLSLHDALPISLAQVYAALAWYYDHQAEMDAERSEEHTSELQSRLHLVCRLLLEKKKKATSQRLIDATPEKPFTPDGTVAWHRP